MTRGVQIALTNVIDPDREPEFATWYDEVHIPATLRLPGFVRASRYRLASKQVAPTLSDKLGYQYLVIYEVDVDMLDDAASALRRKSARLVENENRRIPMNHKLFRFFPRPSRGLWRTAL